MERKPVSSSNLKTVGYDKESMILEIEFLNGSVYEYYEVPGSEYTALMGASSHGSYFSRNIKNRYRYRRIN
jgi:hypothetical protein